MDERTALLYAKTHEFKYLVTKTERFITWALKQVQNPYVACSFGKDSAVMLHLVLKQTQNIAVRFIRWKNETDLIDNYNEVIDKWGNLNLTQVEFSRESLSEKHADRYETTGYDSFFIGLREDESTVRRITLKANGRFFKMKSGIIRISPLAEWQTKHVAAYVFSNNLPTLNTYLKDGFSSRTASRIPRVDYGIRESFLADLKHRDFESFQKLLFNFPEIKEFI